MLHAGEGRVQKDTATARFLEHVQHHRGHLIRLEDHAVTLLPEPNLVAHARPVAQQRIRVG